MSDRMSPFRSLMLSWLLFIGMATFIAVVTPLGEGIDEIAHWDYVQYVAQRNGVPLGQTQNVSSETTTFLENHPVAWVLHQMNPALPSFEQYWQQELQRDARDRTLRELRFSGEYLESDHGAIAAYERHQPPLYYFLAAALFSAFSKSNDFLDTFMALRLFTVLIASLAVPATFLLAKSLLEDNAAAIAVTRVVVLFPGLYPGVVRVSNDALSLVLVTVVLFFLTRYLKAPGRISLLALSAFLLVGLWTKAFFFPIAAGVLLSLLWYRRFRGAACVLAFSVAGLPWYLNTYVVTGSLSGLPETVAAKASAMTSAQAITSIDWGNVARVAVRSHIWAGNWSLLGFRTWMYTVIALTMAAGIAGLLLRPLRIPRVLPAIIVTYLVFLAGMAYYATQVFQATGLSVAQGWYLTALIPIECLLFVAGVRTSLGRFWWIAVSMAQLLFLCLIVYSEVFVAMPYYSGLTGHAVSGHLSTYHPNFSDFGLMAARLLRFHVWVPLSLLWPLLLAVISAGFYSIGTTGRDHYRARKASSTFRQ
jgi:hypothetical protein